MDGILLVDKPQGFTSHDVVALIRKRFGIKKAGHAGTLDPMATGLLVVLLGGYTKRSGEFLNDDKEYAAVMTLGADSDTGDAWGKLTKRDTARDVGAGDIEDAFKRFCGTIEQAVPAYSAKKVNGRKLYELARKGVEVKVAPKKITIHSLNITSISLPEVAFDLRCSKGTYVRQLCADMGEALGCGAYMSALRRTASGRFSVKDAIDIGNLKKISGIELKRKLKL